MGRRGSRLRAGTERLAALMARVRRGSLKTAIHPQVHAQGTDGGE